MKLTTDTCKHVEESMASEQEKNLLTYPQNIFIDSIESLQLLKLI